MYQTTATTKELFSLSENKPLPVEQVRTQHTLRFFKAALDYIIVIPGILFLLPLFALLALAVRLDSPGPIIHRRRVLGKDGRVFHAYKFRTMYVNGDEILNRYPELKAELAENHKLKNDPRITRIGSILRKFSLDELPQLFNIAKQDMSLVGPRIIAPNEITKYGEWGETLLTVMPGLTGLWQVSGRSNTTYDDRVQLDMTYIHNYSLWLDIKIILKTVPAVLKGEGAY
jgi:lipopolysaccharide/colanic/teichoic acid biosynthesis glycosyltransferase